jgi:hypothetical protein
MNQKLILATANFCGPCRVLKTRIEKENLSHLIEVQILEDNPDFFKQYSIKSVPKLISINDGVVDIIDGSEDIIKEIKNAL